MIHCKDCRFFDRDERDIWLGDCTQLIGKIQGDNKVKILKRKNLAPVNARSTKVHWKFGCPYGEEAPYCPACEEKLKKRDSQLGQCVNDNCWVHTVEEKDQEETE